MAFSFNGIGTIYYGKRDINENGSYITTKFFIFAKIPIIPLGSYIVMPHGPAEGNSAISFQQFDAVPIPLNWKQILNVYLAALCCSTAVAALLFAIFLITEHINQK